MRRPALLAGRRRRHAAVCAAALAVAGCAGVPDGAPVAPAAAAPQVTAVPPAMQYLYGSGEAAAISVQAWRALVRVAAEAARVRPADSVVLAAGATLAQPRFVPCGAKPLAAVFDVDETVLLNLGAEYDAAVHPAPFDPRRWDAWERTGATQVAAVPGAAKALAAIRALGITVIFNTNRAAANAAATAAALNGAGLGPATHGETLFLKGDDATGGMKDQRRQSIAARYCVVAMGGDQLGDFSDLFNAGAAPAARRAATLAAPIARLWGNGWFVLPNPTYGTALKGGVDDVFPADKRWTPDSQGAE